MLNKLALEKMVISLISKILSLHQNILELTISENEGIVISVVEKVNHYGKIGIVDINLFSTLSSPLSPIANLHCELKYDDKYGYLHHVFIHDIISKEADKGYGSHLMSAFIDYLKRMGASMITGHLCLDDMMDHKDLLFHFYEKFGFVIDYNSNRIRLDL